MICCEPNAPVQAAERPLHPGSQVPVRHDNREVLEAEHSPAVEQPSLQADAVQGGDIRSIQRLEPGRVQYPGFDPEVHTGPAVQVDRNTLIRRENPLVQDNGEG